eukprot:1935746-Rhodomonas_salina.1
MGYSQASLWSKEVRQMAKACRAHSGTIRSCQPPTQPPPHLASVSQTAAHDLLSQRPTLHTKGTPHSSHNRRGWERRERRGCGPDRARRPAGSSSHSPLSPAPAPPHTHTTHPITPVSAPSPPPLSPGQRPREHRRRGSGRGRRRGSGRGRRG